MILLEENASIRSLPKYSVKNRLVVDNLRHGSFGDVVGQQAAVFDNTVT